MKKILTFCATIACSAAMMAQPAPQLNENNIEEVLKAMTLHEKALLVVGTGMSGFSGSANLGSFAKLVPGAAGTTYAIPRLGITSVVLSDGPAGLRINPTREYDSNTYYCTHFPIGTCLSSSWNTQLVQEVGSAIGNEVLEYGADVLLAPGVCLHRNPLCGRNFEYYSEDPVLSGYIAAAYINGVQSQGVGTSIKHYAFNNQETARLGNDVRVSQRAARELYLKNFEIAIRHSQPWTVMSSYNSINGTQASERRDLLTTILRDEWGFKGLVMTDWTGGNDPIYRDGANDRPANMVAGNDLIEPGFDADTKAIEDAVKAGKLDVKYLDECVKNVLKLVVKSPRFKGYKYSNKPDLKAHAVVTRNSAAEGVVLLENKGALPFASNIRNVALFGVASYDAIAGGTGSGNVNRAYTVSLVEGMRNNGYTVDDNLISFYSRYIKEAKAEIAKTPHEWWQTLPLPKEVTPSAELGKAVAANDIAVITLERLSGEGADRTATDFNLSQEEKNLINSVTAAFHKVGKKAIVVLNVGGVIESASWKNIPDAVLLPWQPGQEFGNSVAEILCGKLSPSGKLPMTWPVSFTDVPSSRNFPSDGLEVNSFSKGQGKYRNMKNVGYTNYEEGIYVGYRYFDSFNKSVSYPFGYGLSYTTFSYGKPIVTDKGDKVEVSVAVTNNGKRAGKEVAEVYVTAPKGTVEKPAQELKAFAKTRILQPGESQTLSMTIDKKELASFNEKASAWIADAGTYTFKVGASSRDIKGSATLNAKKQVFKVRNVLQPKVKLNELSKK
ncbi:glycoside hydrolase family 3 C-terminal domain-containing protein [Prevotella denticola]|jgi:glycoside hydrolase, family 3|uniref:glycoside hydrolase family 3 C-terminal domain-containing protein n=1 Tax=Prevotella denticola TaxID=28129 RepID=UPI001C608043|nr:glycoside hydrolase family 3 C-terminal domain-containing protein [Prevotella denticola]MBW4760362.1 glycoside hydrolase family 3 C-terminal domain-containing protein [Prevotella denticola]